MCRRKRSNPALPGAPVSQIQSSKEPGREYRCLFDGTMRAEEFDVGQPRCRFDPSIDAPQGHWK